MKKMILTPKKDTITFCLPDDWVGKPMVCILKSPYECDEDEDVVSYVSEDAMCYSVGRFRKPKVRRKLRKKRGITRRKRKVF